MAVQMQMIVQTQSMSRFFLPLTSSFRALSSEFRQENSGGYWEFHWGTEYNECTEELST
jgi:hypothetical protein